MPREAQCRAGFRLFLRGGVLRRMAPGMSPGPLDGDSPTIPERLDRCFRATWLSVLGPKIMLKRGRRRG